MTLSALIRQAAAQPAGIAIINNGARIDYRTLARSVARFAAALRALGLSQGAAIAIQCEDQNLHLVLLLACEAAGLISLSFQALELEAPQPLPLLAEVDLVLTERPGRATGARRVQAIDREWVDAALASRLVPPTAMSESPDDPLRIQRTSGTTGSSKRVLLRRALREARIDSWMRVDEIAGGQRILIALRFTFAVAYWQAAMALRAGATIVFETRVTLAEALMLHAIDRVTLMPLQLRELLDRLPDTFVKPSWLAITTMGGRVAPALRQRALDKVAMRLREVYSGNEVGNISVVEGEDAIGQICPGVRVEIVDDRDSVLPLGRSGRIRVKTNYMVDLFLDDPATTARMFRQGWFYPGDVGILHGEGRLEMVGREDDLLNIGGHKMAPTDLEETIHALISVDDVGVCVVPDAKGIEETWVAVVYDAPDDRDLVRRLEPAFRNFPFGRVRAIKLASIPRTDTGKIKRAELKDAVIAAAKARGAAESLAQPSAPSKAGLRKPASGDDDGR